MKQLVLILSVLLLPVTSGAASYSWTDPAGTIHFTDDLGSVPPKYRGKALRQAAGEETAPFVKPDAEAPKARVPAAAPGTVPQAASGAETMNPSALFGGRSAAEWQTQFRQLRVELAAIEQKREALKQESGDGKKPFSRQQITDLNTRNRQLYDEYEAARLRFNQLVEQANKAGLPSAFSQ